MTTKTPAADIDRALNSALRFAGSRSAITADDEKAIWSEITRLRAENTELQRKLDEEHP